MSRSLKYLRDQGYYCEITEHFNSFSKTRKDLLGWADIMALGPVTLLLVQTTTKANLSARVKKIQASETYTLVRGKVDIEAHGWYKKTGKWQVEIKDLS